MSRVTELEKALTTLFCKGTEVGYTETEIDEFLENIDYHALLQAVWNKAETVYAYRMKHIRQTENDNVCLEVLLIPLTFFPLTEQATAASFRLWSILKGLRFIFWRMNRLPESISIRCGQRLWRFTEAAISV